MMTCGYFCLPFIMRSLVSLFCFADQLSHGPHRAVDAPAARLEQHHSNKAQHRGCQHHAVETKGKLSHAGMEQSSVIGPIPRKLEGPEQRDHLPEILRSGKNQVCIPEHLEKHDKKPDQETIAKGLAFHPFGNIFFS